MHARNPAVIDLSVLIKRTPSAVALKLVNFASLDPELRDRGVEGMRNTSKADREVWEEFYGRWNHLAETEINMESIDLKAEIDANRYIPESQPSGPTDKTSETHIRLHQRFFRNSVLAAYDGRCCITGISCEALLRASHIVPWAQSPNLRLDPRNGLCLNSLHDAAFDQGLITLSDRLEVIISPRLESEFPNDIYHEMFGIFQGKPITAPERFLPSIEALDYHRNNIFGY